MKVQVRFLPADTSGISIEQSTVIVFDVLRATSTITSALAAGVSRIRAFASLAEAQAAARGVHPHPILCGEAKTLKPEGFDLGNSPRQFTSEHKAREVYLATTNGTRALSAAKNAAALLCGSLVNASAVARVAMRERRDTLLLCAGTDGAISQEDILGAGAVANALDCELVGDPAKIALNLFRNARNSLLDVLRESQGGINLIRAGLQQDIDFCSRLDALSIVGKANADLVIESV